MYTQSQFCQGASKKKISDATVQLVGWLKADLKKVFFFLGWVFEPILLGIPAVC